MSCIKKKFRSENSLKMFFTWHLGKNSNSVSFLAKRVHFYFLIIYNLANSGFLLQTSYLESVKFKKSQHGSMQAAQLVYLEDTVQVVHVFSATRTHSPAVFICVNMVEWPFVDYLFFCDLVISVGILSS